jgi:hypothetical protein
MNPTSEDIARAIVEAAKVTGAKPLDVYEGRQAGIYAGKVGKARGAVCFALAGSWGREAEDWALWFGWSGTEGSAYQFVLKHRRNGVPRGKECAAAARAIGLPEVAPFVRDNARWNAKKAEADEKRKAAAKRREETVQAAREELAKASPPAPAAKPARIVGSKGAARPVAETPKPAPAAAKPPASESEAIERLLGSIPDKRGEARTCHQRGW